MKITFLGHSCFLFEATNANFLTDPFITANELAKNINISDIKTDFIFVSHGHQDHVLDALSIAKNNEAKIVSNYEIVSWFSEKHNYNNCQPMNYGGNWNFDFGKVKFVNAIHSSVLPDGTYGGNAGGFVFEVDGKTIYFAGDTALTFDMKLLANQFKIDVAILPIGDCFTMGIDDAIIAADFVNCKNIIGMHYDTFGFIKLNDKKGAIEKFEKAGKKLTLLNIGASFEF